MRKRAARYLFCFALLLALAACAPRGEITVMPDAVTQGTVHPIFVATSRQPVKSTARFSGARSERMSYARFDIAVPPAHLPGEIEWPQGAPDPAHHFVTTAEARYSADGFTAALNRALMGKRPGARETVIFVHGFNSNFSEGLYRLAQITHDFGIPGAAVSYSWPSAGNALGYVYDRDSALVSREGLARLFRQVAASRSEGIVVVAHSMGAFLTMEALRELSASRDRRAWRKIDTVILMSPDIDIDVFRAQARQIGTLPQPFFIFTSRRDQALKLSAGLTGQRARLGSVENLAKLAELDITVIDTTAFGGGDNMHHFTAVTSPAAISVLRNARGYGRALNADEDGTQNLLPGTVTFLRNATQVVLSPLGL